MKTKNTANLDQDIALIDIVTVNRNSEAPGAKRESDQAFQTLFEKYSPHLLFIAQKGLDDKIMAEDFVMQTFEKAYTAMSTYNREKSAFNTWLYNILKNLTIDHYRQKGGGEETQRRANSLSNFSSANSEGENSVVPDYFVDPSANPEQQIVRDDVHTALRLAINKMKNHFRKKILKLRYFDELSYEEIAEQMERPLGTIKASLKRAKDELRTSLKNNPLFQ